SQIPAEVKDKDEHDLKILDLLPTKRSATRIITMYLVQMQNNFIQMTNPNAD
ncbi:E3 ubiquitin-protein ligase, partial [Clarias magur]